MNKAFWIFVLGIIIAFLPLNIFAMDSEQNRLQIQINDIIQNLKDKKVSVAKILIAKLYCPDLKSFLVNNFGEKLGEAYTEDFKKIAGSLGQFVELLTIRFQKDIDSGYTEVECRKIETPEDICPDGIGQPHIKFLLSKMKNPFPLYEVILHQKDKSSFQQIFNFVIINGAFKLIGQPSRVTCGFD